MSEKETQNKPLTPNNNISKEPYKPNIIRVGVKRNRPYIILKKDKKYVKRDLLICGNCKYFKTNLCPNDTINHDYVDFHDTICEKFELNDNIAIELAKKGWDNAKIESLKNKVLAQEYEYDRFSDIYNIIPEIDHEIEIMGKLQLSDRISIFKDNEKTLFTKTGLKYLKDYITEKDLGDLLDKYKDYAYGKMTEKEFQLTIEKAINDLPTTSKIPLITNYLKDLLKGIKIIYLKENETSEGELYYLEKGVLKDLNELLKLALRYAIGGYSPITLSEIKNQFLAIAKTVYMSEINNPRYLPLKDYILDKETLDIIEYDNTDIIFDNKLSYSIDREYVEKLKKNEINEEYFKGRLFKDLVIDRFYDNENKQYLYDMLGSIIAPTEIKEVGLTFIKGAKNTGKDTLDYLIHLALEIYHTNINMKAISTNYVFGLQNIKNKWILTTNEKIQAISEITNPVIELIKALVGGSILSIPQKYQKDYELVRNIIKIIWFLNELPTFSTIDDALLDRINIIETQNPLSDNEKDHELKNKLENEKVEFMKFLLWCYWDLRHRGLRPRKRDSKEILQYLLETGLKDIMDYINSTRITLDPTLRTSRKIIYEDYKIWANLTNKKPITNRAFYDKFPLALMKKYQALGLDVDKTEYNLHNEIYYTCGLKETQNTTLLSDNP